MLSLRNISRTAFRSASRLSAQPARRTLTSFYRPSALTQTSRISSLLPRRAAFSSTSVYAQTQDGQVDGELSAKLQEEYNMEEEMSSQEVMPPHLADYLESSGFTLEEKEGSQEVTLKKQFGNETITVSFSIADLDAFDADTDPYATDPALGDEGLGDEVVAPNGKAAGGAAGRSAEAAELAAEEDMAADDEEPSFPAHIQITIEKPTTSSVVQFSGTASDGQVVIENVFYYPSKEMATSKDVQVDWNARSLYTGPPYGNLDEDLQVLMERYLEERGINTELALWVPEYVDYKEQREYLAWLQNIKGFVDA